MSETLATSSETSLRLPVDDMSKPRAILDVLTRGTWTAGCRSEGMPAAAIP